MAPPWPGHYTMLSPADAVLQVQLDTEAASDMVVGRWTPTETVELRFVGKPGPAKIGAFIAKYYYRQSGFAASVFSKLGSAL